MIKPDQAEHLRQKAHEWAEWYLHNPVDFFESTGCQLTITIDSNPFGLRQNMLTPYQMAYAGVVEHIFANSNQKYEIVNDASGGATFVFVE